MCLRRMSGCLLLTTHLIITLLATALAARVSSLVRAHWVIPTVKENHTALKQPLVEH